LASTEPLKHNAVSKQPTIFGCLNIPKCSYDRLLPATGSATPEERQQHREEVRLERRGDIPQQITVNIHQFKNI
jgi:hypothetical protein